MDGIEGLPGERRVAGEPPEPISGFTQFRGLRLAVGARTFVPRVRTEFLADLVDDAAPSVLLDLCCGVAPIAAGYQRGEVFASDIDAVHVEYARKNAPHAAITVGDLFTPLSPRLLGRFEVVAASAPQVPTATLLALPGSTSARELRHAYDGGPDGLAVHRRIAAQIHRWLSPHGVLMLETVRHQAEYSARILRAAGLHTRIAADPKRDATVVIGSREPAQLR